MIEPEKPVRVIWCSTCGAPRDQLVHPCIECRDWQFSLVVNPQYQGWLERGGKPVVVQPEMF